MREGGCQIDDARAPAALRQRAPRHVERAGDVDGHRAIPFLRRQVVIGTARVTVGGVVHQDVEPFRAEASAAKKPRRPDRSVMSQVVNDGRFPDRRMPAVRSCRGNAPPRLRPRTCGRWRRRFRGHRPSPRRPVRRIRHSLSPLSRLNLGVARCNGQYLTTVHDQLKTCDESALTNIYRERLFLMIRPTGPSPARRIVPCSLPRVTSASILRAGRFWSRARPPASARRRPAPSRAPGPLSALGICRKTPRKTIAADLRQSGGKALALPFDVRDAEATGGVDRRPRSRVRPAQRPCHRRRSLPPGSRREHDGGHLGPRRRYQSQGHVPVMPGGGSAHAGPWRRRHRQHRVGQFARGLCRPLQLLLGEIRRVWTHRGAGHRVGTPGHPRRTRWRRTASTPRWSAREFRRASLE